MRADEQDAIEYRDDLRPDIGQIIALYRAAELSRPLDDSGRIQRMYDAANLVLTAWAGDRLIGILRAWSDGGFLAYIADLAVDPAYQGRGIGRELLCRATSSDPDLIYLLHAAPTAMEFYRHTGWRAMQNAWVWPRERQATTP
jgi:ribosomal protein S18 acetylase RimI-like enzyme